MKNLNPLILIVAIGIAALATGCGKKQSVDLAFSNYTVASAQPGTASKTLAKAPSLFMLRLDNWMDGLFPKAHAAISQVKMCFKRLRFKQENESTNSDLTQDEDNVDLTLGLVTLNTSGTALASVEVPKALYKRIEFDLEDGCGVGYSLLVDNSGVYQTTDRITIKFSGSFDASAAGGNLALSAQNIITALSGVTNGNQLKNTAEGASGSF